MVRYFRFSLPKYSRGFHLITEEVLQQLPELPLSGMLQVFIQHTSAGICINENADSTVLDDFKMVFDRLVPEVGLPYTNTIEGLDDMPAHIKSVMCGAHVSIPIIGSRLALGTWQGIYLCEFRNHGGRRNLIVSIIT